MRFEGSFGKWLRQRRKALDLTQQDLADQVSYSVVTLRKIERDLSRPSKQMAEQLADVLAITADERPAFMNFARRVTDTPPALPVDLSSLTPAHNLPAQSTVFIGREAEQAQIASLLSDPACRLLTLVGPGGIGKTRLAVQAALKQVDAYRDGVVFISLMSIGSSDLIPTALASAVQLSFHGQEEPDVQVVKYLRGKHQLLVIDNYEHLLPEVRLLTDLLANAPYLKLLVTSRERLNLREEWTLPVEGLSFPDKADNGNGDVGQYSAVQLFLKSGHQVQPNFTLDDNVEAVISICRAVEGMPLGIELAATWLRAMTCQQIAEQIKHDLDFLATPLRDVPERHRSLRTVFEHSWDLLSTTEQSVLMKLSVFRGGFDPEAAGQIATASLPMLVGLVDKSLVRLNTSGRYELHELLRQFAADKLLEANETAETRHRHFQYFLHLAEQLDQHYFGPEHIAWMDRLESELDNFRFALEWVEQVGDAASGLRMAGALGWFWNRREYWKEGLGWLEKFRASSMNIPLATRAKAVHHSIELAYGLGSSSHTSGLCEEGFTLAAEVGDPWLKAWLLTSLGYFGYCPGVPGEECLEEAVELFRKLGDQWGICESQGRLAHFLIKLGNLAQAGVLQDEVIQLCRQAGDKSILAWTLFISAVRIWHEDGSDQRVESIFRECLVLFHELGYKGGTAGALCNLGAVARRRNDAEQARTLFQSSLRLSQQLSYHYYGVVSLLVLGVIFCEQEDLQRGIRLLGAVTEPLLGLNSVSSPLEVEGRMTNYERGLAAGRAGLGEAAYTTAFAEGQQMTFEQAIAYALDKDAYAENRYAGIDVIVRTSDEV